MGNWLGLGSAWVSGQEIFSGYTANNYPRSTFDLVVFGGKFNASWKSQTAKRETSSVVLLLLIPQYPVDLAIQNFILRRRFSDPNLHSNA